MCNHMTLTVTKNLSCALQRFRRNHEPRAVWIDQLCIDQSSVIERSQQVRIMQKIYAKAKCVLIWLGESENDSDDAMHFVPVLISRLRDFLTLREHDTVLSLSLLARIGLPDWGSSIWTALGHLLTRPYFERVWVIQEVVYAQDAVVVCGGETLPWSSFLGLVQHPGNLGTHLITACIALIRQPSVETQDAITHLQSVWELKLRLDWNNHEDTNDGFADILATQRGCKATDPRDKVLSLLGVMPEVQQRRYDAPDYSESLESIYTKTARRCIAGLGSWATLYILHSAGRALQNYSLPSWVPDWSMQRRSVAFREKHFTMYRPVYSATGPSDTAPATYIDWSDDLNRLIVRGKIVTCIRAVGPEFVTQDERLSTEEFDKGAVERVLRTEATIEDCLRLSASVAHDPQSLEAVRSACRQTLLGGKSRTWMAMLHHAGGLEAADADQYFHDFKTYVSAIKSGDKSTTGYATSNVFALLHREATMGRAFFITDRYVGLGPIGCQEGDKIAIIFGCFTPFILREEACAYTLIGDSYIQGLMKGEAMEMTDIPVQEIHLG
jgi:Heterokaryon incompatibility protein (HET)